MQTLLISNNNEKEEETKKNKRCKVFFDMKWSDDVIVIAPNARAARAKAFVKFIKKLTQGGLPYMLKK